MDWISEEELRLREEIIARVQEVLNLKRAQGEILESCPFGTHAEKINDRKILQPLDSEIQIIERIFELRLDPYIDKPRRLSAICSILEDEEVFARGKTAWSTFQVARILRSTVMKVFPDSFKKTITTILADERNIWGNQNVDIPYEKSLMHLMYSRRVKVPSITALTTLVELCLVQMFEEQRNVKQLKAILPECLLRDYVNLSNLPFLDTYREKIPIYLRGNKKCKYDVFVNED